MAWWQASAVFNGVICACYLGISWNVLRGLRDTRQMWSNPLALATAGIFFTCAVHHGSHTVHLLLPYAGLDAGEGAAMRRAFGSSLTLWDLVGSAVAIYYLSLRRSYGRLLTSPQMFEDAVQERTERNLRRQAFNDALTGLPNRAAFVARMTGLAEQLHGSAALLFLDVDRFKMVNDTLGHLFGDDLLRAVADRLAGHLRTGDELFRLGGDEFTVLCTADEPAEPLALARRLNAALAPPFSIDGQELYVTASIGVAVAENPQELSDLLRRADTAMYRAKDDGRGTARLFHSAMSDHGERLRLFSDLRRGLERGEFVLEFQPIVNLHTGRVEGAEALVRWYHPDRGRLLPGDFVPAAEESGQIVPLGQWVLVEACRRAATWVSPDGSEPPYVTVNVSPIEVERESYLPAVAQALAGSGLPPGRLWLELTEAASGRQHWVLEERLRGLADLGVRVALDDFGTGWSAFSHLTRYPVQMVKVDRSFVAVPHDPASRAVVESIARLGRSLGIATVAEGIETEEQRESARRLGCTLGQGYLLGRPEGVGTLSLPPPRVPVEQAVPRTEPVS